jgi:hypothetical protein
MEKYIKTLSKINSRDARWISFYLNNLDNDFTLADFGYRFQEFYKYDGNPVTDTSSAMFEAYCYYKNNQLISKCDAIILKNRAGVLDTYYPKDGVPIMVTVKDLIMTYEGNAKFQNWLLDLAK